MIVFMYIRQREPAKIVSKEWKLTIVFLRGLNVVSPEGNGRTQRLFIEYLAEENGYSVDFSQVTSDEMIRASAEAFACQYDSMNQLFQRITRKVDMN